MDTHVGFPYDQVKISKNKRYPLPDGVIYGHFAHILAKMDGEKNMQEIIREVEWETHEVFSENTIKRYINAVMRLSDAGYLSAKVENPLDTDTIVNALQRLGVKEGDLLLVHSSNSQMGYINGGADTIIDSIIHAVGPTGTFLMPVFTRPFVSFEGNLNKRSNYRPFRANGADSIWTGMVPKTLLERSGVQRSAHATHSWAGIGPLAVDCVSEHGLLEPPASENSPMAKALEHQGKVLFFGCDINCNTFLHYLEDQSNATFLENAIVKLRDESGRLHTEVIKKHVPGHRDFYRSPAINSKFYQRALAAGLDIHKEKLGLGWLYLIDLQQLYDIGMQLFAEDPNVTLCDDTNCLFCKRFN